MRPNRKSRKLTLLEQLTHVDPDKVSYTESVCADVDRLLNSTRTLDQSIFSKYPGMEDAAINYGLPPVEGKSSSPEDIKYWESQLREALIRFEPRIIEKTLEIDGELVKDPKVVSLGTIEFKIYGLLRPKEYQLDFHRFVRLDIDSSEFTLRAP